MQIFDFLDEGLLIADEESEEEWLRRETEEMEAEMQRQFEDDNFCPVDEDPLWDDMEVEP